MSSQINTQKSTKIFLLDAGWHVFDFFLLLLCLFLIWQVIFSRAPEAGANGDPEFPRPETISTMVAAMQNQTASYGSLPDSPLGQPRWSIVIPVTAYSSEPWQTDDSPFVTASGTMVRNGVVAANFLRFGTKIRIPEIYGDKVFVVEDRMNERYYYHLDIWMEQTPEARNFGRKFLNIEIF